MDSAFILKENGSTVSFYSVCLYSEYILIFFCDSKLNTKNLKIVFLSKEKKKRFEQTLNVRVSQGSGSVSSMNSSFKIMAFYVNSITSNSRVKGRNKSGEIRLTKRVKCIKKN